ncbi:MAG: DNA polymerase III subunit delta [Candidatus Omnitrophica bacterium]|nr:DNA polymerase III subunit delta [Candidatus Omnitrophota bacterium]
MSENYLIVGDDDHIREVETTKLKDKFLSPDEVELSYSVFTPENIDEISDSMGTLPFLSDKRVVVVKEAEALSGECTETIISYLEKPLETTVLVLSAAGSFKKSKAFRKLSALANVISADKPDPATIKNWIRTFFKKEGVEISGEAVELIVELKGTDTIGVKEELYKLLNYVDDKKIGIEQVEQLVGRSVTESIFKMVDAINIRDAAWCFRILSDLYDQKKQPQEIIGYLSWYIRVIQKITLLTGKGIGLEGISSELGYSQAYARRLMSQANKYPVNKIKRWTSLLFTTDRDIKTGRKTADLAIDMLLVGLINS